MAIMHGMPLLYPVVAGDELLLRVLHDFDEMPTLRLTTAQAMRLWDRDRPTCQKALDILVEAHLLHIDAAGRYARTEAAGHANNMGWYSGFGLGGRENP